MNVINVYRFYSDGFRQMTIGKTLWALIIVKLFIMFFILKLFFFPSYLGDKTNSEKENHVSSELINRSLY